MSSAKWRPFCLGLNVLIGTVNTVNTRTQPLLHTQHTHTKTHWNYQLLKLDFPHIVHVSKCTCTCFLHAAAIIELFSTYCTRFKMRLYLLSFMQQPLLNYLHNEIFDSQILQCTLDISTCSPQNSENTSHSSHVRARYGWHFWVHSLHKVLAFLLSHCVQCIVIFNVYIEILYYCKTLRLTVGLKIYQLEIRYL